MVGETTGQALRVRALFDDRFTGVVRKGHPLGCGEVSAARYAAGRHVVVSRRHTGNLRAGMFSFPLPLPVPAITVSMLWHPRLDADPVHRWLRGCVRAVCKAQVSDA